MIRRIGSAVVAVTTRCNRAVAGVFNGFNFAYTDYEKHEMVDAQFDRKW
jgi:hypothetical protein